MKTSSDFSKIEAKFNKIIYPRKENNQISSNGFTVISFTCLSTLKDNEAAVDEEGMDLFGSKFTAIGNNFPDAELNYILYGEWITNKYGKSFQIKNYEEVVDNSRAGVVNYLTTLDTIGIKTAKKIYNHFKDETLDILDSNPEKLLDIKGISEKRLKKILLDYNERRGAREVITELAPLGLSNNQIYKLYNTFKADTVETIKNNPYIISKYIGFQEADKIAVDLDIPMGKRVAEAMYYTLNKAQKTSALNTVQGSLYMYFFDLIVESQMLLEIQITDKIFKQSLNYIHQKEILFDKVDGDLICYKKKNYEAEISVANSISRMLDNPSKEINVEKELSTLEEKYFRLIGEQEEAVFKSLENDISIITGGPGTGKTTIIKFITEAYHQAYPSDEILLLAPTGRAAKKMSESTGMPALTIHKALQLTPSDEGNFSAEELDAKLVVVDEVSMMDIHLADTLFKSVQNGTKLILVGDIDQLPSIGPGSVLNDLIESERIPVTKLDKIYRVSNEAQNIALNSKLIKNGNVCLDYTNEDGDFQFIHTNSYDMAEKTIIKEYLKAVEKNGIEDVCLLTPFRTKTKTGVDNINPVIQEAINPPSADKKEITIGSKVFRVGDKVMQTLNVGDIANGDIGYIIDIDNSGDDLNIVIDFDQDRIVDYGKSDMENIVLAYATTIHKSQGSEYKVVIINLMDQHSIMLKRNLLYTAVTRAKNKCILIGTKSAINKSIQDNSMQYRYSRLIKRIQDRIEK